MNSKLLASYRQRKQFLQDFEVDVMIARMAEAEGINEKLKASDQLGWISRMNSIRQRAEKIILSELIYG